MSLEPEKIKNIMGFYKHRHYFTVFCLGCGNMIGRSSQRKDSKYDFFNPYLCSSDCELCKYIHWDEDAVKLDDVIRALGIFKTLKSDLDPKNAIEEKTPHWRTIARGGTTSK